MGFHPISGGSALLAARIDEWPAIIGGRLNVLLVGREEATKRIVAALKPHLERPWAIWRPGPRLRLPERVRTVVLRRVDHLTRDDQHRLLSWMTACRHRVQLVSTAAEDLFARVVSGDFLD